MQGCTLTRHAGYAALQHLHPCLDARRRRERTILGAAAARALFVPAFRTAAAAQAAPPAAFLLTATLGASNGFSCACAMMRAPANVPPAAAGLAGNLMVLFLVAGLCLGATASFAWLLFPLHP